MRGTRGHRNGKTRTSLSTTTMPRLTGPLKFLSFWPRTTWQWSPHPPHSPDLAPCDFCLFPKLKLRMKGRKFDTIEEIQEESHRVLDTFPKKGLPGMLPSMAETLGPLYSCKRGVIWWWWRNLTSKVSKLLFTSTVMELLDNSLYYSVLVLISCPLKLQFFLPTIFVTGWTHISLFLYVWSLFLFS